MKSIKILEELRELKAKAESTIPSSYMSSDEEASVEGSIAAYGQAIEAVERLRSGKSLNEVLAIIDDSLEQYVDYKQANKEALKLDEDNYRIYDSVVHYIAAIDKLKELRELINGYDK